MGALLYLDFRFLRNQTLAVIRSPGRLALWVPYVLVLAWFAYGRTRYAGHGAQFAAIAQIAAPIATAVAGIFMAALGAVLLQASGPRIRGFRSTAEAVLFNTAGIPTRTLLLWLQIRKLASTAPRWFFSFIYILIFVSFNLTLGAIGRILIASLLAAAVLMTLELPAFLVRRKPGGVAIGWVGGALLLAGALYAFAGFATTFGEQHVAPQLLAALHLDPGRLVEALISGPPQALALLAIVPFALVAAGPLFPGDARADLYAAAAEYQAFRQRVRGLRPVAGDDAVRSNAAGRIPSGAWTILWKDWISLRRGRFGVRAFLLGAVLWAGIGTAIVYAPDRELGFTFLSFAAMFVLLVPIRISYGLFAELSKPIWWLSHAPLRSRIAVWTISKSWPGAIALGMLPLSIGVLGGYPWLALAAIPISLGVWWPMHVLGLAMYAAFPSRVDIRGPMAMLRLFATLLYLTPPTAVMVFTGIFAHSFVLGAVAALLVLVVQGFGFFELSVRRIRENGAALSTLERAA
jgi:hypothetical protein